MIKHNHIFLFISLLSCSANQPEQTANAANARDDVRAEVTSQPLVNDPAYQIAYPLNSWSCDQASKERIDAWLMSHDKRRQTALELFARQNNIPMSAVSSPPAYAVNIDLNAAGELFVNGGRIESPDVAPSSSLNTAIPRAHARRIREANLMKQEPPELAIISLLVQPNVPAEVAVRTIELIKNLGYTDLSVSIPHGIADPPNPANVEPPLPAIQARAKKLVPDTTSVYELNAARDRAIKSAIRACPAMTELFEKLVILTPEMRVDFLQEYTGRFWLECGCRADIELFTMLSSALMWELEEEPATTSLRLGPDPTPLPYALDQTWADLFPHIARRHPNAISFTPR